MSEQRNYTRDQIETYLAAPAFVGYATYVAIIRQLLRVNTKHAIEGDVVENFGWGVVQRIADMDGVTSPEGFENYLFATPEELQLVVSDEFKDAMQPAIDKAVAEERARCVEVCRLEKVDAHETDDECDFSYNRAIDDCIEAIEQGGGDAS